MELSKYKPRNGSDFTVVSMNTPGEFPVVILADGKAHLLTAELRCPEDSDYDLIEHDREQTRYFNVYRAADGGFVFGSKAFRTDAARRQTHDAQRALYGLQVTINENGRSVEASLL